MRISDQAEMKQRAAGFIPAVGRWRRGAISTRRDKPGGSLWSGGSLSCILALLLAASIADAQGPVPAAVVQNFRAGFRSYSIEDAFERCKTGMWAPLYVDVLTGPQDLRGILTVECPDDQGVGTSFPSEFRLAKREKQALMTYIRMGSASSSVKVRLNDGDDDIASKTSTLTPLRIGGHLYLTLGMRLPDFQETLTALNPKANKDAFAEDRTWPRFGAFETEVARLPDNWIGYDAVDLMILGTSAGNRRFSEELLQDTERLKAIAQWTRQGGRLVVSVDPENQAVASDLLSHAAWQPPLPVALPRVQDVAANSMQRLIDIENFAGVNDSPFPAIGSKPVKIALLSDDIEATAQWEVLADTIAGKEAGKPLIARIPYGLGQITLIAFDLDQGPFREWDARISFLKAMLLQLEPAVPQERDDNGQPFRRFDGNIDSDLTSIVQRTLDSFDVPVISFGWVALFIFIYILIVGPLDYIILKKVFKRLEWTWITFPTVVIVVSVAAYFTAYAIKGNELKINKIDLVDFDMRPGAKETYAAGTTWFSIMSPRIQHYTIGVEASPETLWPGAEPGKNPRRVDVISWLGRPEVDGPGAMGLERSQWTRRAYVYSDSATGLTGVPIPVWTTKAFTARWQSLLRRAPLDADLHYHLRGDMRISGKLKNNLALDLHDAWLFYRNHCYPLGKLAGAESNGQPLNVALENRHGQEIQGWLQRQEQNQQFPRGLYDPTETIKSMMFLEKIDLSRVQRNYFAQHLDQSWRLRPHDENAPEAIIYGRIRKMSGAAETVNSSNPLPTRLWLHALPGEPRPTLQGSMNQDTYVRVIIPIQPG